jgi:putative DNA primase/helicase
MESSRDELLAAAKQLREEGEPLPPDMSDDALALEVTKQLGEDHRYTARWGKWHRFLGQRWVEDGTLQVFDRVRLICRERAALCEKEGPARAITSGKTIAAVERLARADRAHAAVPEQWDADLWMLCTPDGAVDLRTGTMRPAKPEDYFTRQTAVGPSNVRPQRFMEFLDRVTVGDVDMQSFLQRVAGYCLTGSTDEHAMFYLHGDGGNGKGTYIETHADILNDYAKVAPIETFIASRFDRHPTELAMLQGARLVRSQETEKDRRWAEAKIKSLTGGDRITAHYMRQDNFEFQPQFKLLIAGNDKPHLLDVGESMRRRFHLIPFTAKIPATERILGLKELLRAEWSGILGWAIEGCLAWQREGLNPPARVRDATEEYFDTEDTFQMWLDECCELHHTHWSSNAELFRSWSAWADAAGERPGSAKSFSQTLAKRPGLKAKPMGHKKTRGFTGIRVLEMAVRDRQWEVA